MEVKKERMENRHKKKCLASYLLLIKSITLSVREIERRTDRDTGAKRERGGEEAETVRNN